MDLTEGSETSANINQMPGNHPKVDILNSILIWCLVNTDTSLCLSLFMFVSVIVLYTYVPLFVYPC
jgi:hypothetical protein